ncbi:hypothetical protein ACFPOE_08480 [Caenimonas terrae]|uniref:Uncharacterized protein n=1 Tax=Caenimonas terrae TaxID=696074 RepID=A0ABW0NAM0_9BURK
MNNPVTLNQNLVLLARVLERLDHSAQSVDAEQYRSVVNHLSSELAIAPQDAGLQAVLQACPAAAELYENLNYQHAGLCRAELDVAMASEAAARNAIAKARGR